MPSVDALRCFLAGAKHLNFRRAAQEVHLTPTAFGQRIKQLEELLERRLFARTTRSVALTREGLALVPVAKEALNGVKRCAEAVLSGEDPPVRLMVGTRFELGLSWLLPAFLALETSRPAWHLDTYFGSGSDILNRLRAGDLDCVVTSSPIARAEWAVRVLHPEEYVLVGAPGLLTSRPFEKATDAGGHTLLEINENLPLSRYLSAGTNTPLTFGDVRFVGSGAPIVLLAQHGVGVAVLPRYMVKEALTDGSLVPLLPTHALLTDTFRLLFRHDHPLAAQLDDLADFLRGRPLM